LRELHKASGGAWGGTQVDKAYEEGLLANIVGKIRSKYFIYIFHVPEDIYYVPNYLDR
jgi:hypothetical protein